VSSRCQFGLRTWKEGEGGRGKEVGQEARGHGDDAQFLLGQGLELLLELLLEPSLGLAEDLIVEPYRTPRTTSAAAQKPPKRETR
jgi:hypothetical protein